MELHSFFLTFTLLLTAAVLTPCSPQEQMQGKFDTSDGSKCVWFELRKSGSRNVFVTACHCKSEEGARQSYSCEYDGPMTECELYQTSPNEFYSQVATSIQKNHSNGCEASTISVTECPQVTLQKSKGNDPLSPCVPETKEEL